MGHSTGRALPAELLALTTDTDAICMAIDRAGAHAVDPPVELAARFAVVTPPGHPLASIHPSSQAAAVSLFEQARRHGHASGDVRTALDREAASRLHIFDLAPDHDCLAVVVQPAASNQAGSAHDRAPAVRRADLHLNASGVIIAADDAIAALLGWEPGEVIGRPALDLIDPDDHERSIACWVDVLAEPGATERVRHRWQRRDGGHLWVETTETNRLAQGAGCVVAELSDISEEMAAHAALRAREELLVRLTEALPTGVLQIDASGATVFSNPRWFQITQLHREATFEDLVALCGDRDRARIRAALTRTRESGLDTELEVAVQTTADHQVMGRLRMCALGEGEAGASVLMCLEDVTESHHLQRRLVEQAQQDPLTGLLNRSAVLSSLEDCIRDARGQQRSAAVLFVDLDDFKSVNDRFGHAAGDDLLRRVAAAIRDCVRTQDLVGRLGGDEFVVVIPDLVVPAVAAALARRLEIELSSIIVAPGERLVSGSIGVGVLDGSIPDAEALLAVADDAMYRVKRRRQLQLSRADRDAT